MPASWYLDYSGPCPPPDGPHPYVFRLFALAGGLTLSTGAMRPQFDTALGQVTVLGEADLTGYFAAP